MAGLIDWNHEAGEWERKCGTAADGIRCPVIGRCSRRRTDDDPPDDNPPIPPAPNPNQLDLLDPRNAEIGVLA